MAASWESRSILFNNVTQRWLAGVKPKCHLFVSCGSMFGSVQIINISWGYYLINCLTYRLLRKQSWGCCSCLYIVSLGQWLCTIHVCQWLCVMVCLTSVTWKHISGKPFTVLLSMDRVGMLNSIRRDRPTHPGGCAVSTSYENTQENGKRIDGSAVKREGVDSQQILPFFSFSLQLRNVPVETKQRRKQTSIKLPQCLRC